jgi:hypothetical protein
VKPVVARQTWRTLEPVHGMTYFVPETADAFVAAGLRPGLMGYFASRAAAMGPVPAEVVISTFCNFWPGLVRAAIPEAWARATPARIVEARLEGVDRALRRGLGPALLASDDLAEAAALARRAAEAAGARPEGRPLFAGHASLAWPDAPHLVLWHAQTLLREFRGDGHVAALTAAGVGGLEALVLHEATGEVPGRFLRTSRAWPADEWAAGHERLVRRGWLAAGVAGAPPVLTDAGRAHRREVEDRTDELALPAYAVLGEDDCARLRQVGRPISRAVIAAGLLAVPPG